MTVSVTERRRRACSRSAEGEGTSVISQVLSKLVRDVGRQEQARSLKRIVFAFLLSVISDSVADSVRPSGGMVCVSAISRAVERF
jgi:hypothetical protein